MSSPNDYVTHGELQGFMTDLLSGIGDMIQQSENRMKMYIENGVEKQVQVLSEKVDSMDERLGRVEQRLDRVEQRLDRVEQRLDRVEKRLDRVEVRLDHLEFRVDAMENQIGLLTEDVREIKEIVSVHDDEIITLKRVR